MKLKKLLNENVWNERKFGEPLPTLEDTSKAYKLKKEEEVKEEPVKEVSYSFNTNDKREQISPMGYNLLRKDVITLKDAVKYLERSVKKQHQADTHHDLIYLLTRAHEAYKNSKVDLSPRPKEVKLGDKIGKDKKITPQKPKTLKEFLNAKTKKDTDAGC